MSKEARHKHVCTAVRFNLYEILQQGNLIYTEFYSNGDDLLDRFGGRTIHSEIHKPSLGVIETLYVLIEF